ncbi:MAG: sensor histidine kinase [Spirochaetales bacterium]|nr:sensor histidine kinase [Spirochaetales bacterium]
MTRLFRRFLNQKLRTKLLLSFIVAAIIPLAVYTLAASSYYLKQAGESARTYTRQLTSQVSSSIRIYMGAIENLASYMARKEEVRAFLANGDFPPEEEEMIHRDFASLLVSQPEIAGLLLIGPDDRWISAGISRVSRDSVVLEEWFVRARTENQDSFIYSTAVGREVFQNDSSSGDDLFFLVQTVRDGEGRFLGVLLLDIAHSVIEQAIENISILEKGFLFVYDQASRIVYAPVNPVVYRVNPRWFTGAEDSIRVNVLDETYQIESLPVGNPDWKAVGVFSVDEIQGKLIRTYYMVILLSLAILLFLYVLFHFLTKTLVHPLIDLKSLMSRAAEGDFSITFQRQYADEVGELGENFNFMIGEINNLIQMVYKEQHDKQEAQLKSLQEQIKPHFLYNTLDTINWMARDYGADDIVKLIDALTTMFRVGLSHGKDIISLGEELSHASNYLYIQGIRYREKIDYKIDVDNQLHHYLIPKLILQPLIENAIYHGLKTREGKGLIAIAGETRGKNLILSVTDNGSGMDGETLARLNRTLTEDAPRESFGLFYVNDRIRLYCGRDYGLSLMSEPCVETKVILHLPLIYKREDFKNV